MAQGIGPRCRNGRLQWHRRVTHSNSQPVMVKSVNRSTANCRPSCGTRLLVRAKLFEAANLSPVTAHALVRQLVLGRCERFSASPALAERRLMVLF
jgi:hypothetical protein